jgi:hypothetical protein
VRSILGKIALTRKKPRSLQFPRTRVKHPLLFNVGIAFVLASVSVSPLSLVPSHPIPQQHDEDESIRWKLVLQDQ